MLPHLPRRCMAVHKVIETKRAAHTGAAAGSAVPAASPPARQPGPLWVGPATERLAARSALPGPLLREPHALELRLKLLPMGLEFVET